MGAHILLYPLQTLHTHKHFHELTKHSTKHRFIYMSHLLKTLFIYKHCICWVASVDLKHLHTLRIVGLALLKSLSYRWAKGARLCAKEAIWLSTFASRHGCALAKLFNCLFDFCCYIFACMHSLLFVWKAWFSFCMYGTILNCLFCYFCFYGWSPPVLMWVLEWAKFWARDSSLYKGQVCICLGRSVGEGCVSYCGAIWKASVSVEWELRFKYFEFQFL